MDDFEEEFEEEMEDAYSPRDELWDADPNCDHEIVSGSGGGIRCTKCPGWFCF